MNMEEKAKLFDKQAKRYDKRRRKKSFDHKYRKRLLEAAKGKVLELSVGAGVNFQFYPEGVEVTAVDISAGMLEKAEEAAQESRLPCQLIQSDVESLHFEAGLFDTAVSTLSLCAYEHPVDVLTKLSSWVKPEGHILLLEHGISSFALYAWLQNRLDAYQYKKVGCHANRDILDIVRQSGIQIEKRESLFLNSVHLIWARS